VPELLTIGRFAECTGLTVKALRLYDRSGLLRPALVDVTSGYRYYDREQVAVGRSICRLRSLRMPLTEIAVLLAASDQDAVRTCLDRHRQRLTDRLREEERALNSLPTTEEWWVSTRKDSFMNQESKTYTCSFCGKDNADVKRMIAGPKGVFICNECVAKCNQIIAKEEARGVEDTA
jgi:DNA-binding transcriptional MerR regulator